MALSRREKLLLPVMFAAAALSAGVALNAALMEDSNNLAERTIGQKVRAEGKKLMENRYGFAGNGTAHNRLGQVSVHEKYVNVDKKEACTVHGVGQFFFGKVINVRVEKPACQPW